MAKIDDAEPHAQDNGAEGGEQNRKHDEGYKVIRRYCREPRATGDAEMMKKHLEAMRDEVGKLAPGIQEFGEELIATMAQNGMKALQGRANSVKAGNTNKK
jgi:hypothetical protein